MILNKLQKSFIKHLVRHFDEIYRFYVNFQLSVYGKYLIINLIMLKLAI